MRRGGTRAVLLAAITLGLAASGTQAQTLYGVGTDNHLYRVDPTTAATTDIGPLDRMYGSITIDPVDGKLYGYVDPSAPTAPNTIRIIDKANGVGEPTSFAPGGALGTPAAAPLMAITPASTLYTLVTPSPGSSTLKLGTLDKSSWAWTPIGTTTSFPGFGFASAPDGTLYAAGADNTPLMTVDKTTGATTNVVTLKGAGSSFVTSMAIDQSGAMFVVLENDSGMSSTLTLATVDRATGAITPRGAPGNLWLLAFDKPDPVTPPASNGDGSSSGVTEQTGAGPSPQPAVSTPTSPSPLGPFGDQLIPRGRKAKLAAILRARGYRYPFKPPAAGTLTIEWRAVPLRSAPGVKPVLVAAGRTSFATPGPAAVNVRLTTRGRARLRKATRVALQVRGVFTSTDGRRTTATKTVTLRR